MLLSFAACVKEDPASIEFKAQEYQMLVGQTKDLMGELEIKNSEAKPVFESSNEAMASVTSEGVVTAHDTGEVTINAMLESVMASCRIRISSVKADTIVINAPKALKVDTERSVTVTVKPAEYNKENLEWTFTPSVAELKFEAVRVSGGEYKVRFVNFIEGAKLAVKVADRNSDLAQVAEIEVIEDGVAATALSLDVPEKLTATLWATVTATVGPDDYDPKHLEWNFVPSSDDLGFTYKKVSDLEYEVCFSSYVRNGFVTISVTDKISAMIDQNIIKVAEYPKDGVSKLSFKLDAYKHVGLEPFKLEVIVEPEAYDENLFVWTSTNEEVATVERGLVNVLSEGETTIKVKDIVSEKEATCAVTIVKEAQGVQVRRIDLDRTTLGMRVGEEDVQLVATCYDEDGNVVENYANLEWSADQLETSQGMVSIVEVSQQGVVTAKNSGSTIVTVNDRSIKTVKAICHVNVSPAVVKVREIKLYPESKVIPVGKTYALEAVISPADAEDKTLTYSSSDESVATVDEYGVVTGVSNGSAYITARSANGITGDCEVIVANAWVEFNSPVVRVLNGEERTLTAKVMPEELGGGTITWSSSAPEVVSVDQNGKIKALALGDAQIKAVTSNGIEGTCQINVINDYNITFTYNEVITTKGLYQFESFELEVNYTNDYVPESVVWESSDPTALKITQKENGKVLVEAVYEGKIPANGDYPVTLIHKVGKKEKELQIKLLTAKPREVHFVGLPEGNTLYLGEKFGPEFGVEVIPSQASQAVTYWGDVRIYSVANGSRPTYEAGYLKLAATATQGDVSVTTEVYITVIPRLVEGGTLSASAMSLECGKDALLTVDLSPFNDPNYDNTLVWSSSDPAVATVENGVVTGVKEGNAIVSVKLSNGQVLNCEVTVVPAAIANYNVGDYYYSTGKISSNPNENEAEYGKVVGVIFSVESPVHQGDGHLDLDHPNATHGLVLAMEETANIRWQETSSSVGNWLSENRDYKHLNDESRRCGYGNTQELRAYNAECSEENKVLIVECAPAVELPSSTSGWYVPSYEELKMVYNIETNTKTSMFGHGMLSLKIQEAGGTPLNVEQRVTDTYNKYDKSGDTPYYWSTTENAGQTVNAAAVNILYGPANNKSKSGKSFYNVRYIFAF